MDRRDEITDLLRRIEQNQQKSLEAQEKALQAHEKHLALAQAELERSSRRVGESIELQRLAAARQAQVRNLAVPLIVVVLFLIGYLMVKYRIFWRSVDATRPSARVANRLVRTLRRRWRLLLDLRQRGIDAGPARRGRRPDRHRRLGEIRIVERADADEDQVRTRFGLAEERRSARWAESAPHRVAAVRDASIGSRLAGDLE